MAGDLHRNDGSVVEGFYPAVVTRAEWNQIRFAASERSKLRGQLRGGGPKVRFLFQAIVRCVCGAPMGYHPPGKGARVGHPGFVACRSCHNREAPGPGRGYLPADQMEAHCLTRLGQSVWAELLADPDAEQERRKLQSMAAELSHLLQQAKAQLERLELRAEALWAEEASEERMATAERAVISHRGQVEKLQTDYQAAALALQQAQSKPSGAAAAAEIQERAKDFWRLLETAEPADRQGFNRWLLTHPLQPRFVVGPKPLFGGDRLVQLWMGGRLVGSEPFGGLARLIARDEGIVDPAAAVQVETDEGTLVVVLRQP